MKLNNKGFTLVELLISIALMALIMTSIFSFVNVVSRFYTRNNRDITVQNEAQTVMTQIDNMMVDANVAVEVENDADLTRKVYIVSTSGYYVIQFNPASSPDTGTLYLGYLEDEHFGDGKTKEEMIDAARAATADYLLAEYVDYFKVTPHLDEETNYVETRIELRYSQAKNSYKASQNMYLRNRIVPKAAPAA